MGARIKMAASPLDFLMYPPRNWTELQAMLADPIPVCDQSEVIMPKILTAREAARVLRISEKTLWSMTKRGDIPAIRCGTSVRYDERDLIRWMEASKTVQAKPAAQNSADPEEFCVVK
jgi:excisionase family DNA binding protein